MSSMKAQKRQASFLYVRGWKQLGHASNAGPGNALLHGVATLGKQLPERVQCGCAGKSAMPYRRRRWARPTFPIVMTRGQPTARVGIAVALVCPTVDSVGPARYAVYAPPTRRGDPNAPEGRAVARPGAWHTVGSPNAGEDKPRPYDGWQVASRLVCLGRNLASGSARPRGGFLDAQAAGPPWRGCGGLWSRSSRR